MSDKIVAYFDILGFENLVNGFTNHMNWGKADIFPVRTLTISMKPLHRSCLL